MEHEMRWRSPDAANSDQAASKAAAVKHAEGGIEWEKWSVEAVAAARKQGRVVFVDFTAKWCLNCKANAKTSIEINSVRAKLKELNAVTLIGDFTKTPEDIKLELQRHGRAGVPLVLVYPKDASKPPIVLPELLTPTIVLDALKSAGG